MNKSENKWMTLKNRRTRKLLSAILTTALIITLLPVAPKAAADTVALSNPRIVADGTMKAGQKVTWDCVYFGSYPQAEVITAAMSGDNYTAIDSACLREGDLIVDDTIYTALESAAESGWDANGDITLNDGSRYRRMLKADAAFSNSGDPFEYRPAAYNWLDATTYHYFKYQPIKWKVLSTDGSTALLLSDVALDDQRYSKDSSTWETCTLRSWLNGYGAAANDQSTDYSSRNFMDCAFSSAEQAAIIDTGLENADNLNWGVDSGNDTTDRLFCLSESEVYRTDMAERYGFAFSRIIRDEARRARSSTYAKAMGTWWSTAKAYEGNCYWWLRSKGRSAGHAVAVGASGYIRDYGSSTGNVGAGVRVALNLNLSASSDAISSNLYSYAGTVCSDEMVAATVSKVKSLKAKAGKQKLTITWKTVSEAAGYQIQVSTQKNFQDASTVTVSSSETRYVAKKLKRKEKYYVRIRACMTYNDADNVNQTAYGKWTKVGKKTK